MNNYLIHLIETFDHNTGTTTCGLTVDTWTIKYPELKDDKTPLQYGYSRGYWSDLYQITCETCRSSDSWKECEETVMRYINQTDEEIIARNARMRAKFSGITLTDQLEIDEIEKARKYLRSVFGVYQ